jgi:hypothetical protein
LLGVIAGCSSNSERKQAEAIAKRNPLDMAGEDSKTIVITKEQKKPRYEKVPQLSAREAPYIAGKHSRIYHARNCQYAGTLDSPVGFASWEDAERSGHIPCEFCKPRESAFQPPAAETK